MIPSRRFILLFSLGLLPALAAVAWSPAWTIAVLYDGLLLVLLAADLIVGSSATRIECERRVADRLSLGGSNPVTLAVRSFSPVAMVARITDTWPVEFNAAGLPRDFVLGPFEEFDVTYHVTPTQRGNFAFGDVFLRVGTRLGLGWRDVRLAVPNSVKVYPNVLEVKKLALVARRTQFALAGSHRLTQRGQGRDFESLRDYLPDDDFRWIDWKATARRRRSTSRVYEIERNQRVLLAIDSGRLMAAKCGDLTKLDYSINAALVMAYAAIAFGDEVGLMVFSHAIETNLAASSRPGQYARLLDTLYDVKARLTAVEYRTALDFIAQRHTRRSLIVFFTDLADESATQEFLRRAAVLCRRHVVLVLTINDPQLIELGKSEPADAAKLYSRGVATELLLERAETFGRLRKHGAIVLDKNPEEISIAGVNQYLDLKYQQVL